MLSFEQLIQNLTDKTQPSIVRSSAISELAAQANPDSVEHLIAVLSDSDTMVRREAATALQRLGATDAVDPLLAALKAESNDLTLWALLETVGELATADAIPKLESLRTQGSLLTGIEVKKSIARIQERAPEMTAAPETPQQRKRTLLSRIGFNRPDEDEDAAEEETEHAQPHDSHGTTDEAAGAATQSPEDQDAGSDNRRGQIEAAFNGTPRDRDRDAEIGTDTPEETETQQRSGAEDTADTGDTEEIAETGETIQTQTENVAEADGEAAAAPENRIQHESDENRSDPERSIKITADDITADDITDVPFEEAGADADSMESESAHREKEEQEIQALADSIAHPSHLAASASNLPVLAPTAATVPYQQNRAMRDSVQPNYFLALIHPGRYLSRKWVRRSRVYLILWALLLIASIGFMQYQKRTKAELSPLSRFGISVSELPEYVKRSLAEGDFYIQEGYYRKAIRSYELSRGLGSLPMNFYRKLGYAYFKEGQYALALEAYQLFLEAKENENPDIFAAEASIVGVHPFTSVGERTTRDYETYNILGTTYMKLGRTLEAQRAYEKAIQLAPKHGEAYNNLARLYAENHGNTLSAGLTDSHRSQRTALPSVLDSAPNLRTAETLAYLAVTLNPDVAAYHDTLGWVLAKRGLTNRGMRALERSIYLQRDTVAPHYHLAQIALKADARLKATEAIRNVFHLDPVFVYSRAVD